jgi:hypothetical protein
MPYGPPSPQFTFVGPPQFGASISQLSPSPSTSSISSNSNHSNHPSGIPTPRRCAGRTLNLSSLEELYREREASQREMSELMDRLSLIEREILRMEREKMAQNVGNMSNHFKQMLEMCKKQLGQDKADEMLKEIAKQLSNGNQS